MLNVHKLEANRNYSQRIEEDNEEEVDWVWAGLFVSFQISAILFSAIHKQTLP
jgi:hypothetical protein